MTEVEVTEPRNWRYTAELVGDELVRTPAGDRVGRVRALFRGGLTRDEVGHTTVQLYRASVRSTTGDPLPRPRAWVTVPDDAVWTLIDSLDDYPLPPPEGAAAYRHASRR